MRFFLPLLLIAIPEFALHLLYYYGKLSTLTHVLLLIALPVVYVGAVIVLWQLQSWITGTPALPKSWQGKLRDSGTQDWTLRLVAGLLLLALGLYWQGYHQAVWALALLCFLYPFVYLTVAILLLKYADWVEKGEGNEKNLG